MLSDNAMQIFKARYAISDTETWEELAKRIATVSDIPEMEEIIANLYFLPAGRILRNLGRTRGSVLNCYLIPISDDMIEIMEAQKNAAILWSEGGGVGINMSSLRPGGSQIMGKGGYSSGPVSFLKAFDGWSKVIETGGGRRAATTAFLRADHPDIHKFLDAKLKDGELNYIELGVHINDSFLDAVEADTEWPLQFNQKQYGTQSATNLWNKMLTNMLQSGEPGLQNMSNLQANNSYYFARIEGTNPCISGNSLISTTFGEKRIKDLTKYKQVDVYTRDPDTGELVIKPARFFRTKTQAKVMRVHTTRGSLICTPNHVFITPDGDIEAQNLKVGDNLYGLLRRKANERSFSVGISGGSYVKESRFVAGYYYDLFEGSIVHHLDNNPNNNSITNLQVLPHYIHSIISNEGHDKWCEQDELGRWKQKNGKKLRNQKQVKRSVLRMSQKCDI